MPRHRTCDCGFCKTCRDREKFARWWEQLTEDERREWAARKDQDARRAADRRRYAKDRTQRMAAAQARREQRMLDPDYKQHVYERAQRWRLKNPEKSRAHDAVARAKKAGKLAPQPCSYPGCLRPGVAHHNEGYSKDAQLKVEWLCHYHHRQEHREEDLLE